MGLHINYELWLPGSASVGEATHLLEQLRAICQSTEAEVGPLVQFSTLELLTGDERYEPWSTNRWAWVFAHGALEGRDGKRQIPATTHDVAVNMFFLYPGDGSEAAPFGLVRPSESAGAPDATRADLQGYWYWYGCCKTQYASRFGDDHLLRCHRSVVDTIEAAMKLGLSAEVRDETGYWETRSVDRLVSEVRRMNQIVARFAGAVNDAAGPGNTVESPIFSDPDFERLESEPIRPNSDQM
ncbi:MAG TPA: hypothetical protein VEB19_03200 [Gemmatimonadaceae bacterium]|nr:hypothetical protein [Gemmatimonadaceae bacterium]